MGNTASKSFKGMSLIVLPLLKNYFSRKEWEVACWRKIFKSEELLDLLMTSNERHDLVMRVAVANSLASGKSYREISKEFFVSLQTINSIKKSIREKIYKSYRERGKTDRKKKKYNPLPYLNRKPLRPEGIPRRTKYGTIYLPRL